MNFKTLSICCAFLLLFIYAALIVSLFTFINPAHISKKLLAPRLLFSLKLSLKTAFITTIISTLIAIPTGFALSRYNFYGKQFVDIILELPLVISPVALGATLLIFFNTSFGRFIQTHIAQFVFTVNGIILAQFVTTAGLTTRIIKTTFDEVPARTEAVAKSLGASPWFAFKTVTLPSAKNGIISAMIISFAKSLGEFGATVTLAGSMPKKTETLAISIYLRLASAKVEETVFLILILIFAGISIIFVAKNIAKVRI